MRAVVTVTGTDKRGIIAKVSALLSECGANIEEISQTVLAGQFTMIMLIDISSLTGDLAELADSLSALGGREELNIRVQHADIFDAMHVV